MKKINVVIVDDNPIVGKNIMQRIIALDEEAMAKNSLKPNLNVTYIDGSQYKYFDFEQQPQLINDLQQHLENADYLLSDIYVQDINLEETSKISNKEVLININNNADGVDFNGLTQSAKDYLQGFSKQASDLYKKLPYQSVEKIKKRLKKVIVYTYSPNAKTNELPERARYINEALKIQSKTEVFSSHQALYQAADFDLYKTKKVNDKLASIGLKCDYGLYGAALGEILYHKIIDHEAALFNTAYLNKRKDYRDGLVLYFFMFLSIDLGGNALFDMLKEKQIGASSLAIVALILGLLIPLLILKFKPSLLIWISSNKEDE